MVGISTRSLKLCVITLASTAMLSCGGGGSQTNHQSNNQTSSSEFLYASGQNGQVVGFTIDSTSGTMVGPMITLAPFTTSAASATLAVDSSSKHLFVYDTVNAKIAAFSIDPSDGSLTAVSGSPFALNGSGSPGGLAADPANNLLYVANFSDIAGFGINGSSGALSLLSGSPFSQTNFPFSLTFSPSGGFLYASGSNSIAGFAVNTSTGALTPMPGSPFQIPNLLSPFATAVHPSGKYFFSSLQDAIFTWNIDAQTGALTVSTLQPAAFASNLHAPITNIVIDPAGKFLFASDGTTNMIAAFSIDPTTGNLTLLNSSKTVLPVFPQQIIIDPAGKFLFAADELDVQSFQMDSSGGALLPISNVSLTAQIELTSPPTLVLVKGQ